VLLLEPDYSGTLAAARELGRRGIPVWTAASSNGTPTAHSRFVTRHWPCPATSDTASLVDWLVDFGRLHPGTVLYPTSDGGAWLQSLYADILHQYFRTYAPDVQAIENVLDKRRLFEACSAVGIESPRSFFVESRGELESVARQIRSPVLLKQRTQILSRTRTKGTVVHRPEDLIDTYERFVARNQHDPAVQSRMKFASWPLIQEFHANVRTESYLVTGFVNKAHTDIVAQAARKVLQYPRTLGIALCMEPAALDAGLTAAILALCRHTGHFGIFQIEFLVDGNRRLLIDFNPRYYHYMAFDIARGLPLPWFIQLGACGDEEGLAGAMAVARDSRDRQPLVFSCRLQLGELLWSQRIAGTMSGREFAHWRRWYRRHRNHMVDALALPGDPWPEIYSAASTWWLHLRHPRSFIRAIALDR
jgi:predicted ATP-grasp superfamily ATP-dependent carboligase